MTSDALEISLVGGRLCLDFCNTLPHDDGADADLLAGPDALPLICWAERASALDASQAAVLRQIVAAQPAASLLLQAQRLRAALRPLFVALAQRQPIPPEALQALDGWLQEAYAQRHIIFEGARAALVWRDPHQPTLLLYAVALSAEALLLSDDGRYVKQCPGCGRLFYDGSKNHRRMWCEMRVCGNRAKNRRFHQRRRGA